MKNKILFVVSGLFGLMMIFAGMNKLYEFAPMPTDLPEKMVRAMSAFTEIGWILPLVGVAEVISGILIIIPRTRALGALMIFPVMIGILLINTVQDTTGLPMSIVLLLILAWIMYEEKQRYLPIIGEVK